MLNWLRRFFGYTPPDDIYFDAMYLLDAAHSRTYWADSFALRKDVCRFYITVGYDVVFECSHKNTNPPQVYKPDVWVKDLQKRATAFRKMAARYEVHQ